MRALLFDLDGLLIDSEDAYSTVTNTILREHSRPDLPWYIKAQLQGRPAPEAGRIFQQWAQLPISYEEFTARQRELFRAAFTKCRPLPGVEELLGSINAHNGWDGVSAEPDKDGLRRRRRSRRIHVGLVTSSLRANVELKTSHMRDLFSVFPPENIFVGDDPRVPRGRSKPLPDIYLLALQTINESIGDGETEVRANECLAFEDSVLGVEAARRAGMRVVWCPHPGLLGVYRGREKEVMAGRTSLHKEEEVLEHASGPPIEGSPGKVGEVDDGWAELVESLEGFDLGRYGIELVEARNGVESWQSTGPGATDKELEEMTALVNGKVHASEEGSRFGSVRD